MRRPDPPPRRPTPPEPDAQAPASPRGRLPRLGRATPPKPDAQPTEPVPEDFLEPSVLRLVRPAAVDDPGAQEDPGTPPGRGRAAHTEEATPSISDDVVSRGFVPVRGAAPDALPTEPVPDDFRPADTQLTEPVPDDGAPAALLPFPREQPTAPAGPGSADPAHPGRGASASGPAQAASEDDAPAGFRQLLRARRERRKAQRAEMRRFTAQRRRRRQLLWGSLGLVALLAIGSFAAAYSPVFAVERITVTGTSTLDPAVIEQALAPQRGVPLGRVDESAVKAALVTFPMVESYSLEARPPHELVVRIVERTPVGVVQGPGGYTLVDAAGVALSTTPDIPSGQPVIEANGGLGSDSFLAAGRVVRSVPEGIRGSLSKVTASSPQDVRLTLAPRGTTVVWGSPDDSALKAVTLQAAMKARPVETASFYDVSTPAAIVVR